MFPGYFDIWSERRNGLFCGYRFLFAHSRIRVLHPLVAVRHKCLKMMINQMDLGFLGTFFWDFYPLARSAQSPVRWFGQSGRSQGSGRDRIPDFCSSPTEFVIIWGLTIKMIVDESWYWIFSPAWFLCRSLRTSIGVPYQPIQRDERAVDPIPTSCYGCIWIESLEG